MPEIRVAIIGVGNCCSALVQGVEFYKKYRSEPLGLMHWDVGGYLPSDLKFAVAFDVDRRKVGEDLSEAIYAEPNTVPSFIDVPRLGAPVLRGPTLDGVGEYTKELIELDEGEAVDVVEALKRQGVEIVVNLLPSGADEASAWYAKQALEAGCAFVNATPTPIVSDRGLGELFREASLPAAGDDLMDQIGATILHMDLLSFLNERGVRIDESYQLDVGGGAESLSTLERGRELKRRIKTGVVGSAVPYRFPLVAGSTDYVDFLGNHRDSLFWIKGRYFCGAPLTIDIRLETMDGPNAGAVLLDVIRAVKLAMDRGLSGPLIPVSAYAFKMPPERLDIREVRRRFEEFIAGK
ncbi:MAG: inositol-3-phosphate synthase [Candidatus Bathyarchaeia archaeon]